MSFVFDVELEARRAGVSPANPANPANSARSGVSSGGEISNISNISSTILLNLSELRALIRAVADHWQFSQEEREEALRAALNDPESALTCYRDIAAKAKLSPKLTTGGAH